MDFFKKKKELSMKINNSNFKEKKKEKNFAMIKLITSKQKKKRKEKISRFQTIKQIEPQSSKILM